MIVITIINEQSVGNSRKRPEKRSASGVLRVSRIAYSNKEAGALDDNNIIRLFNERDETALSELSQKYGTYFMSVAEKIVCNHEDSKICVNDAYLKTWEAIPPAKPNVLRAFVGKLVKNAAINMLRADTAKKRGGGEFELVLDELGEFVSDGKSTEDSFEEAQITEEINKFLWKRSEFSRRVFLLRYWYCESVSEIAKELGVSEHKVSMSLYRTRQSLKTHLLKEGYLS